MAGPGKVSRPPFDFWTVTGGTACAESSMCRVTQYGVAILKSTAISLMRLRSDTEVPRAQPSATKPGYARPSWSRFDLMLCGWGAALSSGSEDPYSLSTRA